VTARLFDDAGCGEDLDGSFRFHDGYGAALGAAGMPGGTSARRSLFTVFNGHRVAGTWTHHLHDALARDFGRYGGLGARAGDEPAIARAGRRRRYDAGRAAARRLSWRQRRRNGCRDAGERGAPSRAPSPAFGVRMSTTRRPFALRVRRHPAGPEPGPGGRATTGEADQPIEGAPLKQHGDALLDGSGSRQGTDPDASRDAAPHE
jgi:hypothetical protein